MAAALALLSDTGRSQATGGWNGFRSWLPAPPQCLRLHGRNRLRPQVAHFVFKGRQSPGEIVNAALCAVCFRERDKRQNENRDDKTDYKKA